MRRTPRASDSQSMGNLLTRTGLVALACTAVAACSSTETLELTAQGGDATASCLVFDIATLSGMSPAFAGTVVELDDSAVTLAVDNWYRGGNADQVRISHTPGMAALIGTPVLELDQRYLITAADGAVNGCGYSGPATPELEAAFEEAFAEPE